MKIFAISDLHLSVNNPKPMDIFGPTWDNYVEKIFEDWRQKVTNDDVVLLCGDFSWAMKIDEVVADFNLLKDLPGRKVIIRGNRVTAATCYLPLSDNMEISKELGFDAGKMSFDDTILSYAASFSKLADE